MKALVHPQLFVLHCTAAGVKLSMLNSGSGTCSLNILLLLVTSQSGKSHFQQISQPTQVELEVVLTSVQNDNQSLCCHAS